MGQPWSLDAALCLAYTILVFGLLWADGKWHKYIDDSRRPARELVQGHIVFLLILILWLWICQFSKPWLPDWLFEQRYRHITPFLCFAGLGIVAIWWIEQGWLARRHNTADRMEVSGQ
jgi:hypothetical protein